MNIDTAFPGKYLKHADLQGRTVRVIAGECRVEDIGGEEKPVLYFQGKERGLALNRVNAGAIAQAYGPETDHWRGRLIELYPDKTFFQGRMVDCIRVRVPAPSDTAKPPAPDYPTPAAASHRAAAAFQAPPPAPPLGPVPFDDDIPF
jgi:hypothetical protein